MTALAVLSRNALTHPVVGIIGAIGATTFGVAPAVVGAAGIEAQDGQPSVERSWRCGSS